MNNEIVQKAFNELHEAYADYLKKRIFETLGSPEAESYTLEEALKDDQFLKAFEKFKGVCADECVDNLEKFTRANFNLLATHYARTDLEQTRERIVAACVALNQKNDGDRFHTKGYAAMQLETPESILELLRDESIAPLAAHFRTLMSPAGYEEISEEDLAETLVNDVLMSTMGASMASGERYTKNTCR